jgi:hypothetical protein
VQSRQEHGGSRSSTEAIKTRGQPIVNKIPAVEGIAARHSIRFSGLLRSQMRQFGRDFRRFDELPELAQARCGRPAPRDSRSTIQFNSAAELLDNELGCN